MKLALAGAGAFGRKRADGIALIDGAELISVVGRTPDATSYKIVNSSLRSMKAVNQTHRLIRS